MMRGKTDRAADERLLEMIGMRTRGLTLRQIGNRMGLSYPGVDKMTRQVREADIAEAQTIHPRQITKGDDDQRSLESPAVVDRAYWRAGRR